MKKIMNLFKKKYDYNEMIKIDDAVAKGLQYLLDEDYNLSNEGLPKNSLIQSFSVDFSDGKKASIRVSSGNEYCYVEAFLLDKNGEVLDTENVDGELLKKYVFTFNKERYAVDLLI